MLAPPRPCPGGGHCGHNVVYRDATEEEKGLVICAGCGDMASMDNTEPYDPEDHPDQFCCPPASKWDPIPYDPEIHSKLRKIPFRWCVAMGSIGRTDNMKDYYVYSDCFFIIKNELTDLENIVEFSQRPIKKYNEELESSVEDLINKVVVLKGRLGIDDILWSPEEDEIRERQKKLEEIWNERKRTRESWSAWEKFYDSEAFIILIFCVLAVIFMGIGALIHWYFF